MKSKNKRSLKLASTFLKDLQSKHASQYERIVALLEQLKVI